MQLESPYIHWRTILFGDTDAAAIVYTPRYADYCMEAAEVWFREFIGIDWYHHNTEQGMGTPVVHMDFDFVSSLIGNDSLGLKIIVSKVGQSTITLDFEGVRKRDDEEALVLCLKATIVFCFFSHKTERASPIPDEQRTLINEYRADCEQTRSNIH